MSGPSLVEFLAARLDEDEYDANAFVNGLGEADRWDAAEVGGAVHSRRSGHLIAQGDLHMIGRHIARHDPARVLADVKAKRAIVELASAHRKRSKRAWKEYSRWVEGKPVPEPGTPSFASDGDVQIAYDITLRHLATAYADHPDYRDEWKP